jgi:hypothetical protein
MNKRKVSIKNECNKTRKVDNPYEVWTSGSWTWAVLKKYQNPEAEAKNEHARWFCAVKSPMTYGEWEYGDTYVKDVKGNATRQTMGTMMTKEQQ